MYSAVSAMLMNSLSCLYTKEHTHIHTHHTLSFLPRFQSPPTDRIDVLISIPFSNLRRTMKLSFARKVWVHSSESIEEKMRLASRD